MGTLLMSPVLSTSMNFKSSILTTTIPNFLPKIFVPSRTNFSTRLKINSKLESFVDLLPESKRKSLDIDLPWHDDSIHTKYDVIIIGARPAGLQLAEKISAHGIRVCCIDPSPLSMWPNNFGVWVDELKSIGLEDCLDKTWPTSTIHIDDHKTMYLDRAYGRVNRRHLKTKLLEKSISQGVKFFQAGVWNVVHEEFESIVSCDNGCELKGSLVVDASGFSSPFVEYIEQRNHGYQIAHGILAEVDEHPFDLDKMCLMDWRDTHMENEPVLRTKNEKVPTFLYAMPLNSNLVYLEETLLVGRPVLSYMEVKQRMVSRLRHLGIKVKRIIEDEKRFIPVGGPLPKIPQSIMCIGGTAELTNPASGYTVAQTLAFAPILADSIVKCLGSTSMVRGSELHQRVWNDLWQTETKLTREFYCFGMETLLKLDLNGTRRFFEDFFKLDTN